MAVELPVEKWSGKVQEVTLGGNGRKKVTVGGQTALPFLHFESPPAHRPVVAIEIHDCPQDWSLPLLKVWGDVMGDGAAWAKKTVEVGADIVVLHLTSAHPDVMNTGAAEARATVDKVLSAVDVPLIVLGPYVPEKDNEVLVAVGQVARGQRIGMGYCEDKNYRTIAVACIADGHVAIAKTPVDINLAKQLNVLIADMGVPLNSIIMDPTTGALGYGLEYTYSVEERLRLAGLRGDTMAALPIINQVGEESWGQKESKTAEGVPAEWGELEQRSLFWEQLTATALLYSGSDILVLRHPQSVEVVRATIDKLMSR